jgi:hypothetical protein
LNSITQQQQQQQQRQTITTALLNNNNTTTKKKIINGFFWILRRFGDSFRLHIDKHRQSVAEKRHEIVTEVDV